MAVWELWSRTYDLYSTPPRFILHTFGTLVAVPLIAYGILRTQLFDIDLRIRWTIKQSTLAAAVVAIVYLVSEGASRPLSAELGNVAGLFAAALVVFFMAPLQRRADRVASAAMPNTVNTPEYAAFRKLQVYESAVAEALQGGGIAQKERALLNRLRDSLGILPADAAAVERELEAVSVASGPTRWRDLRHLCGHRRRVLPHDPTRMMPLRMGQVARSARLRNRSPGAGPGSCLRSSQGWHASAAAAFRSR